MKRIAGSAAVVLASLLSGSGIALTGVARADELSASPEAAAVAAHPDDINACDAFVLVAFRARRWDEAIAYLKSGLGKRPDWAEGYYKLAFANRQLQRWTEAAAASQKASQLQPERADTYYGWAVAADKAGDLATARAQYLRYAALEHAPAKQRFVEQAQKRAAELTPAQTATVTPPVTATVKPPVITTVTTPLATATPADDAPSVRTTANEFLADGRFDEAVTAYQRAIALDDANLDAYAGLGRALLRLRRYSDAVVPLRTATERDPRFAPAWYDLAHALRRTDQKAAAVAAFRRYISLRPDDADPYYGLGQTLRAMGNLADALEALRHYVAIEHHPSQQAWVAKARRDVEALEAASRTGRLETFSDEMLAAQLGEGDEEGPKQRARPPSASAQQSWVVRDLKDPFTDMQRDLIDPFSSGVALRDPFTAEAHARPSVRRVAVSTSRGDIQDPWAASGKHIDPFADPPELLDSRPATGKVHHAERWSKSSGLIDPFAAASTNERHRSALMRRYDAALQAYDSALTGRQAEDVAAARRELDAARRDIAQLPAK